jgi:predicted nucleic-acid-binding protein
MLGVDTNILVRQLVADDLDQHHQARLVIELVRSRGEQLRIDKVVLCELVWVLERAYRYKRPAIADLISRVLRIDIVVVDSLEAAWLALADYRSGPADFADCLIARTNVAAGCRATVTFDKGAATSPGFVSVAELVHG